MISYQPHNKSVIRRSIDRALKFTARRRYRPFGGRRCRMTLSAARHKKASRPPHRGAISWASPGLALIRPSDLLRTDTRVVRRASATLPLVRRARFDLCSTTINEKAMSTLTVCKDEKYTQRAGVYDQMTTGTVGRTGQGTSPPDIQPRVLVARWTFLRWEKIIELATVYPLPTPLHINTELEHHSNLNRSQKLLFNKCLIPFKGTTNSFLTKIQGATMLSRRECLTYSENQQDYTDPKGHQRPSDHRVTFNAHGIGFEPNHWVVS
ncbi:hypothetical protein EVAR_38495_1 [Eumeta japonica]|uniref:Uncharacterized protein n=1 Tax=Eumeta variegata TaxID=151549 RepID=A0A4C1WBU2_EUMVA|nr:hypothetical protein EVAR_38495_1 [Eumeta japonica]